VLPQPATKKTARAGSSRRLAKTLGDLVRELVPELLKPRIEVAAHALETPQIASRTTIFHLRSRLTGREAPTASRIRPTNRRSAGVPERKAEPRIVVSPPLDGHAVILPD
jgi:hypothetical protein